MLLDLAGQAMKNEMRFGKIEGVHAWIMGGLSARGGHPSADHRDDRLPIDQEPISELGSSMWRVGKNPGNWRRAH